MWTFFRSVKMGLFRIIFFILILLLFEAKALRLRYDLLIINYKNHIAYTLFSECLAHENHPNFLNSLGHQSGWFKNSIGWSYNSNLHKVNVCFFWQRLYTYFPMTLIIVNLYLWFLWNVNCSFACNFSTLDLFSKLLLISDMQIRKKRISGFDYYLPR